MSAIQPWQRNESTALVVRHLQGGDCVALPSAATYELTASAFRPDAVERIGALGRPALVVSDFAELADWLPLLAGAPVRLFRKLGAGPVVLEADAGHASGLWRRLPERVRQLVEHDGRIRVRWPLHPVWREMVAAGVPLVSTAIPAGVTAEETARVLGGQAACIIDAGPAQHARAPTVVRAVGRRCVLEQAGALAAAQIDELARCRIVFICTGNTCRSPMAQALCVKMLADALGCGVNELAKHGYSVQSAGLAAMMGAQATPDAVKAAAELGVDLGQHSSRMVTREMLEWADFLFAMTQGHCWTLESVPIAMPAPRMLAPTGVDIADPMGGTWVDYKACAQQLRDCLQQRLPEILES
jgi:protein-tyrosine phosphatase